MMHYEMIWLRPGRTAEPVSLGSITSHNRVCAMREARMIHPDKKNLVVEPDFDKLSEEVLEYLASC